MNILVCLKQPNFDSLRPDRSAVEAALRLKAQIDSHIKVLCIGSPGAQSLIREAMAMGCDEGTLICTDNLEALDAVACAKLLSAAAMIPFGPEVEPEHKSFDVIVTGCYAADADSVQTGLLLAGLCGIPHISFVSEVCPEETRMPKDASFLFRIKRQMEDRLQLLHIKSPCLIIARPLPNKPFYATADGITRAYTTDIKMIAAEDLALQLHAAKAKDLSVIRLHSQVQNEAKRKGTVLTVSTEEAVEAIFVEIREHHLL